MHDTFGSVEELLTGAESSDKFGEPKTPARMQFLGVVYRYNPKYVKFNDSNDHFEQFHQYMFTTTFEDVHDMFDQVAASLPAATEIARNPTTLRRNDTHDNRMQSSHFRQHDDDDRFGTTSQNRFGGIGQAEDNRKMPAAPNPKRNQGPSDDEEGQESPLFSDQSDYEEGEEGIQSLGTEDEEEEEESDSEDEGQRSPRTLKLIEKWDNYDMGENFQGVPEPAKGDIDWFGRPEYLFPFETVNGLSEEKKHYNINEGSVSNYPHACLQLGDERVIMGSMILRKKEGARKEEWDVIATTHLYESEMRLRKPKVYARRGVEEMVDQLPPPDTDPEFLPKFITLTEKWENPWRSKTGLFPNWSLATEVYTNRHRMSCSRHCSRLGCAEALRYNSRVFVCGEDIIMVTSKTAMIGVFLKLPNGELGCKVMVVRCSLKELPFLVNRSANVGFISPKVRRVPGSNRTLPHFAKGVAKLHFDDGRPGKHEPSYLDVLVGKNNSRRIMSEFEASSNEDTAPARSANEGASASGRARSSSARGSNERKKKKARPSTDLEGKGRS